VTSVGGSRSSGITRLRKRADPTVNLLCAALQIYWIVVVARIVMEWIPVSYDHPLARVRSALRSATEPVLGPLRAMLPPMRLGGVGLDLSPIILLVGLSLLTGVICN
jgi:YggT family protein